MSLRPVPLAGLPGRPCPAAAALEVVGERWSLLVVRELLLGRSRFTDVVRGTGAPRDRVAARLRSLEDAGLVARRRYQDAPPRDEYLLTPAGLALAPVIDRLVDWGRRHAVAEDDPLRDRAASTRWRPAVLSPADGDGSGPPGPPSPPTSRQG